MAVFYELLANRGPDGGNAKEQEAQVIEARQIGPEGIAR
jgi:hypothetical protein